jgi:hypothetical protein
MTTITLPKRYLDIEVSSPVYPVMLQNLQPFLNAELENTEDRTITLNKIIHRKGDDHYKFDFTYPVKSRYRQYGEINFRVKIELDGETRALKRISCVTWWQPAEDLGIYYFPKDYGSLQGGINYYKRLGEVNVFDNGVKYTVKQKKKESISQFVTRAMDNKNKYLSYVKNQLQDRFGGILGTL